METTTEALMIDLPGEIATGRFVLRPPRPGDGPLLNAAGVRVDRVAAALDAVGAAGPDPGRV